MTQEVPMFRLSATYATQPGPDRMYGWGEPETRLEKALKLAGLDIVGSDAGTALATGQRDAEFLVQTEDIDQIHHVIENLPAAERGLWSILPAEAVDTSDELPFVGEVTLRDELAQAIASGQRANAPVEQITEEVLDIVTKHLAHTLR